MKTFLLFVLFLFSTTLAYSQSTYQDVVYLKNGGIVRGIIIEQVPDKYVRIETAGRNVSVHQADEIEKLTKEPVNGHDGSPQRSSGQEPGYKATFELGYQIRVSNREWDDNRLKTLRLNIINGYQLNPYFAVGLGTGLRFFMEEDMALIPVFADFRTNFTNNKATPYLSLGIGYSFDASDDFKSTGVGFLLNPSLGVSFKGINKSAVLIGIGYEMQKIKVSDYYYYNNIRTETLDAISINVGVTF